jgi:hypothetical protein
VLDLAFYINYERFKDITFISFPIFIVLIKYLTPIYGLVQLIDWLEFQFWLGQFELAHHVTSLSRKKHKCIKPPSIAI